MKRAVAFHCSLFFAIYERALNSVPLKLIQCMAGCNEVNCPQPKNALCLKPWQIATRGSHFAQYK